MKKHLVLLFTIFFCLANLAEAQQVSAPSLRCVSVLANGNIELTWVAPNDPNNVFVNYQVYGAANAGGPYSQLTTINNLNTTNYTDNTNNPNAGRVYYYITTTYNLSGGGTNTSAPSDTISTIFLTVSGNNTGIANLNWNAPITPPLPSSSNQYNVYKRFLGNPNWSLIGSTNQRTFSDIVTNCQFDSIFYRVELVNNVGCSSFSNEDEGYFMDLSEPNITVIDSLSVDPNTGEVIIGWTPNNTIDVEYYHIYQFNAGQSPPWNLVDSVYGQNSSTSVILGSNGNDGSVTYAIAAFDTCQNSSQFSLEHNTIHLEIDYEECLLQATLEWNEYKNWANGVRFYYVLRSENGGPYVQLAVLPNTTFKYVDESLTEENDYCYIIRAAERVTNNTASSNQICFFSNFVPQPNFAYIKSIDVLSDNSIEIQGYTDTAAGGLKYIVERRVDGGGLYDLIEEVPGTALVNGEFTVVDDKKVFANNNIYVYVFTVVDSCGLKARRSNFAQNILLEVKFDWDTWQHHLKWSEYKIWDGNVASYSIYRGIDGVFDPTPVATISDTVREYTDDATPFFDKDGEFCYYIEANEGPGIRYNFLATSKSNTVCFSQAPRMFIPNAFNPKGVNRIFKPEHSFVSSEDYEFIIFDRKGREIFKTTDKDEGWDGKIGDGDDDFISLGVYVYRVNYKSSSGQQLTKVGRVTVLK